ncbi:MAG: ectoine/hydroxyectoine ABC transporter permease subunit EhuC [bacterium]|nr:ectoine/hydroxyectoine ABC transporter permease subunit EhuC [bacterium]
MIADLQTYIPSLLEGARITVEILLLASLLAAAMSFIAGLARLSKITAVRWIATIYIEFFRGTSVLVQLFWLYFVMPFFGVKMPAFTAAVIALGLNVGAYGAEVVRGAILAVPKEQIETATALNFSAYKRMRYIILPQAVVAMLPPFGNLLIELLKATSLVSLITVADITFNGKLLIETTLKTAEIFFIILIMYFILGQVITFIIKGIESRMVRGLDHGGIR